MTTNEREITAPVDLCDAAGVALNPAAVGWSRRPLHNANLGGVVGPNKRWDYWAVLAGDLVISTVASNLDLFGLIDVWWADLATGRSGGTGALANPQDVALADRPGTAPVVVRHDDINLDHIDSPAGTRLVASWREADGAEARFDVMVGLPAGHESLNVVIPWDVEHFNFTSKHQARPASGSLAVGSETWTIGAEPGADAWGVLDVGRGRWPSSIHWNWGGGAGRSGDHVVGLQFGAKWTEGSGLTENGLIVDGRLYKIGRELEWSYDWDRPMEPWRIRDPEGQIDVTLTPRYDKYTHVGDQETLGSETHQVFGHYAGTVRTDDGEEIAIDGLQGFAEEARQRW